jgi:N6-L-threonylcarbamoyladenine synthase
MRVLGIESSCDETAMAVYDGDAGLLAQRIRSQMVHADYGGVVPELASRDHARHAIPMVQATLKEAGLALDAIDAIAYTQGPGLVGALLVGASVAKTLAWSLGIPSIGIHHLEGHLMAVGLQKDVPSFPYLALLVSGGHSALIEVHALGDYRILGETLDDAAGEAFDKVAKLLGLGFPGGPALARAAEQGDDTRYAMPRPMLNRPGLDFSFSGIKTHVMQLTQKLVLTDSVRFDLAASFERAMVETLVAKTERALVQSALSTVVIVGGVGANQRLRAAMRTAFPSSVSVVYPPPELCTDNAAMIAWAGYLRLQRGEHDVNDAIDARARWSLTSLK